MNTDAGNVLSMFFFADFVHAFPRAWRALILAEAGVSAGTRDGALALLASFLKE